MTINKTMEKISIPQTKYTPFISLDEDLRLIEIKGKSYPENTFEFYKPVMEWVSQYFKQEETKNTIVNIEIIYFNSSSSKLLFDFFDLLETAKLSKHNITVNWKYDTENESALEAGEDFQEDFESLGINLVAID